MVKARGPQALLGDEVPAGDVAAIIRLALRAFIDEAKQGGFAP